MPDINEGRKVAIRTAEGMRLSVTPEQFHRLEVGPKGQTYEKLGAEILAWEDGEAYEPAISRQVKAELREERRAEEEKAQPKPQPKAEPSVRAAEPLAESRAQHRESKDAMATTKEPRG